MGAVWLGSLPTVLEDAGLKVIRWPGWGTRSRSSGGYDVKPQAIGCHHDAVTAGTPLEARCRNAWDALWNTNRPVGALWLHTDGTWVVGAAGATNTQGKGGPVHTSKGLIPLDTGNKRILSIEASNDGRGEAWPEEQQEAYVIGVGALCEYLDLNPASDILAHFEWTDPGESIFSGTKRKIDPAGPSKYAVPGAVYPNMWDMGEFRSDVIRSLTSPTPPPTPGVDMPKTAKQTRVDSRFAAYHEQLKAGEAREVWLDLPPGAQFVQLNVTIIPAKTDKNGVVSIGSNKPTEASPNNTINWSVGDTRAQATSIVWTPDSKTVWIESNRECEFIIDFTGIYW